MTIPIKVTVKAQHKLTRKAWRDVSRAAWDVAGDVWHTRILPKHFTEEGAAEYGYEQRSRKYTARKLRKFGHQRPLEYSGNLKRQVLRLRDVRARAANSNREGGVRVALTGPSYLSQYRKRTNEPNKALELSRVSPADAEVLRQVLDREIEVRMNQTAEVRDVTRGSRA